VNIWI